MTRGTTRNVLFDLDGTLLDSRPGIEAGLRRTLAALGFPPPEGSLAWAIGPPLTQTMARLLAGQAEERVAEAVAAYRDWYGRVGLFDARVYPGVPELLGALSAAGRVLFVSTAKRTHFATRVLGHFGLAGHFQAVHGTEDHGRFDDKAELVRHLLQAEGLAPAETVLVGDREHDVLAGRSSGVRVLAVTYGYGTREELLAAGAEAEALCGSPAEVLRAL